MPDNSPNPRFSAEILRRAQSVQVVFFDIDGVFTDGGIYYSDAGESLKRFHTLDGYGLKLLKQVGIEPVIISGRDSAALRTRLNGLKIKHMALATEDKLPAAEQFLSSLQLDWRQAAAIGDDWPDLPILKRAALAVAPAQAHTEVLSVSHYTTTAPGGAGAVRELCDLILYAQSHYHNLLEAQLT